ncbi:MAG: 2,4-diacetylphloroglucinol specific hydrolase PhlG, partial [Pseudomonadota bacterium]
TPYAKYLNERLTVPEAAARAVQFGPMDPAHAVPPTVEGLNDLIAGRTPTADSGYCLLDGPTMYVQSRVDFPGSTPEMFEWWFWWHTLDRLRYMLWFPYSHIQATVADPARCADESLSYAERVYDNPHHVVEFIGPERFEGGIRFLDPSRLGIDMAGFHAAGYRASASGLLEVPGVGGITVGLMLHIVRPVADGMELLSRYYLGTHPALQRFPGAAQAAMLLEKGGMTRDKLEAMGYELSVHDMTEWNNLARILPGLYREFGPAAGR